MGKNYNIHHNEKKLGKGSDWLRDLFFIVYGNKLEGNIMANFTVSGQLLNEISLR